MLYLEGAIPTLTLTRSILKYRLPAGTLDTVKQLIVHQ